MEAISADPGQASLAFLDRCIVEFARKLTRDPSSVKSGDVDIMRQAGLSDRGILDVTLVTAYFNFVNRIAEGLGVELEGETTAPEG